MKAIVYSKYGGPEVLSLQEVDKPELKEDEVLVKIHAASANPADWHMIRGEPKFSRMSFGLMKPRSTTPGIDIAGQVESVGEKITDFKPGDEVFGDCGLGGGFAEYACVTAEHLVLKPHNISCQEAAAVNVAAITALQGLRFKGPIQVGDRVLVNGASGGVGTFAVQIAKSYGAHVTGVCSTRNLELVRSIGADEVVDYTKDDFTTQEQQYDFILDTVGNRSVADYKRALNSQGSCVIAGFTTMGRLFHHMVFGPLGSSRRGKWVGLMGTAQASKADLTVLKDLLASGKVKPVIDREYSLSETPEAIGYLETGHARGKVIINLLAADENAG